MFSSDRVRQQLRRLADITAKYMCAIVIIGHINKASGEKNLYRGSGSIGIGAIARSLLMISRDKNDPSYGCMFQVKSSLAPEGSTMAFLFKPKTGLQWIGRCRVDKTQIEDCDIDDGKKFLAQRIVYKMLREQDTPSGIF